MPTSVAFALALAACALAVALSALAVALVLAVAPRDPTHEIRYVQVVCSCPAPTQASAVP